MSNLTQSDSVIYGTNSNISGQVNSQTPTIARRGLPSGTSGESIPFEKAEENKMNISNLSNIQTDEGLGRATITS